MFVKGKQVVEKGSECFESLSMKGKSSMKPTLPVRPEQLVEGLLASFSTACKDLTLKATRRFL
jgi:hypothetical protein